jgi:glycosyltransferase involved in cell wall biosynthesis
LVVHYYGKVAEERRLQGWQDHTRLPDDEFFVPADLGALNACPDWKSRIHIVPGYGATFLRRLALFLSRNKAAWIHWSEPAAPGIRWWMGYLRKRRYGELVNNSALGAMAIGETARQDFLRWGIKAEKIHLLPYSVAGFTHFEKDEIVARFCSRFACTFLFLGVLCRRKGVDHLLKAFKKVVDRTPDVGLVLAGLDLRDGAYERLSERLGLKGNVLFPGVLPSAHIGSVLYSCQVLVLPSRFDGWGMVINEAASAGKALIATTACGAAHHLIKDGVNGYRVCSGDIPALAERMHRYAVDSLLAVVHGNASRLLFKDHTPERNAMRLQEILHNVSTQRNYA